ncbi:nucleotide exchange factor SIL1 isoform X2 [Haemorhous mexicanus]|uniref:nucleotide exchange factor SIL1 isoform X2 n=1 Tax=Haemorhous mexicanus TaxID=30427 RepID=UPI0028BF59AE|nr:nucleotide exchange factor SIL1 isoform X2 [Haemorhous mexicanus]
MSPWAGLLSTTARVSLLLLLGSVLFSCSSLGQRVPEFALTKIEESDIKDDSGKELGTEDDADPEDLEVFYPTDQWQTLRPGQAVPAGSHIRLNLQTGEREAKLPDRENGESGTREEKGRKRLGKVDLDANSFTSEELKKALAKIKESEKAERKAREEEVRKKFRPIEQLKEEFEKLNMKIETDYEIMVKLISKFNSSASTLDEKVAALYDLEYYVHQVDNAKDFLSMGGLQLVIEGLNSSEASLKEHAAFVLGAALSSNPKVQIEAIEGGALQKLLVILATEQPLAVRKKEDRGFNFQILCCVQCPVSPDWIPRPGWWPSPFLHMAAALGSSSDGFSALVLTTLHGSEAKSAFLPSAVLWPAIQKGDSSISNPPAATRKMENRNKGERGRRGCQLGSVRAERARPGPRVGSRAGPAEPRVPCPRRPGRPCATALSQPARVTGSAGLAPNCLLGSEPRPCGTAGCWALAGGVWGCTLTGPGPGLRNAMALSSDCGGMGTSPLASKSPRRDQALLVVLDTPHPIVGVNMEK